jgi:mRNA interferase RelE/StbE
LSKKQTKPGAEQDPKTIPSTNKKYHVIYTKEVKKVLDKMDPSISSRIRDWVKKFLRNCPNPRGFGIALKTDKIKGEDLWRYTLLGDYRIIAKIIDKNIKIIIVKAGHRRNIYDNVN